MLEQAEPLLLQHEGKQDVYTKEESAMDVCDEVTLSTLLGQRKTLMPPSLRRLTGLGQQLLGLILPQFLQRAGLAHDNKLHATSYLDGIRGWAAFIVVSYHRFDLFHLWFFQLPFIRTFYSGLGMVDVFFVISGFVLSQRMLKLARSQQQTKLMDCLASTIFRRWLRLYLPCFIITFIAMLMVHLNMVRLYGQVPRLGSFFPQLWHWFVDCVRFADPFANTHAFYHAKQGPLRNSYVDPLWTIPVEFRGSIIVYVFCAGACKLRSQHRLALCGFLSVMSMFWQASYAALFLAGVFLAEISLIRHPQRYDSKTVLPQNNATNGAPPESIRPPLPRVASRVGYACLFTISIFLLGKPGPMAIQFGPWPYLNRWVPPFWTDAGARSHFWFCIASPILIWTVDSWPTLQGIFTCKFSQYLGRISFGIYVTHILVIDSLWEKVFEPYITQQLHGSAWGHVPFILINWLVIFRMGELFDKVDRKNVHFGRWLQVKLFEDW